MTFSVKIRGAGRSDPGRPHPSPDSMRLARSDRPADPGGAQRTLIPELRLLGSAALVVAVAGPLGTPRNCLA